MPCFSIVVPAFNAEATLEETLDAVLAQDSPDWECVVVDDGSTDRTAAIASSYTERSPRVRFISRENGGSGAAYNTGVASSVGDYVVMCSADDVLLSKHLRVVSSFIKAEPGYDIYSTNGYFWYPDGKRVLVYPPGTRDQVSSLSLADVLLVCFYSVGAVYRRSLFDEVGGYRTSVYAEDYDFWLRAMANGASHRYNPAALSLHRVAPSQKSANLKKLYRADIALVTEISKRYELSGEEQRAVDECVQERKRLIEGLHSGSSYRSALRRVMSMASNTRR